VNASPPGCVSRELGLLLSSLYDQNKLGPEHLADVRRSGLTDETIRTHKLRSISPAIIGRLLGFDNPKIRSAMLIPYPDPAGSFFDHVRMKIFPPLPKDSTRGGGTVKYLQPPGSPVRLYFPLRSIAELAGATPMWLVEGEKKALAVAQLGLPAVGFAGIHAWHRADSRELIPDFGLVRLADRLIELVPDGDWRTNPRVLRGAIGLAMALQARGAQTRLVVLPGERGRS
jgi:uncharacterized protein DUF3854